MAEKNEREVVCWSCKEDSEYLHHSIEDALDEWATDFDQGATVPATVTLYGYAHMRPSINDVGDPLDYVLERLDEEYGNPDGDSSRATPELKAAEDAFIAAVLAAYKPWMCERVSTETINVAEYIDVADYGLRLAAADVGGQNG